MIAEPVATGRRRPLVVLLIAAVLIGLLAWKPWDRPTDALPRPTVVVAGPTVSPAPARTAVPPAPAPTPGPVHVPGYAVSLRQIPSWPAVVQCRYEPDADGMFNVLSRMFVGETVLHPEPRVVELDIRRVTWRAVVQVNRLESLFSANWETVGQSRRRVSHPAVGEEVVFNWASVAYPGVPAGTTMVARVVVSLKWFGPGRTLLGTQDVVAPTYWIGGSVAPEGCHVFVELAR